MIKRKLELDREVVTSVGSETAVDDHDAGVFPGPSGCFCSVLCTIDCSIPCPTIITDTGAVDLGESP